MTDNPTWLPVVAAALVDGAGRLLMHRRPPGKAHGGLWEFPGGKVEAHETPAQALLREIEEELGVTLDPAGIAPAVFAESLPAEDAAPIVILLYTARRWRGEPRCLEGGACAWLTPEQAAKRAMPPLDRRLLALLTGNPRGLVL